MEFEYNLSLEELKQRTSKDCLIPINLLDKDSEEYQKLDEGDKTALIYLSKAAEVGKKVYMKQDNPYNLEFEKFLTAEIEKGSEKAKLTKILFDAQSGIIGIDSKSQDVILAKNFKSSMGKAFYPIDLSVEEFHCVLIKMLERGKINEVKNILSQRTMVIRDGEELKGVDYTIYFKTEFELMAECLKMAAHFSTDKNFSDYLIKQVDALVKTDPMLDAEADKLWANLQDTPLEFTISREQYADMLTGTVMENETLNALLKKHNIEPQSKDSIGVRVGIVNKSGTEDILRIKDFLPFMAENMPFNDKYEQNISKGDNKQTMVDVDLVSLRGDEGAYRGGITIAQNLPNNDKLSLTIGGGRRNVYHRQIRTNKSPEAIARRQKRLDSILNKDFHKFYNPEADHWFTIGHENVHSLGPNSGTEALGKYQHIIEENKADMGSVALLNVLVEHGAYTEEQKKEILVTFVTNLFLKAKPTLAQAHRVRSVMQCNYFLSHGAMRVEDGKIVIDIDKVIPAAYSMLSEIVEVQLSKDFQKGEKYVLDNFIWGNEMEEISKKLQEVDKSLNGTINTPLADYLITLNN